MSNTLSFKLTADDAGWPPYESETMPIERVGCGFRIVVPPLFVKGLSVGDVITGELDSEGYLQNFSHVMVSRRSTVWVMLKSFPHWEQIQTALLSAGCKVVPFRQLGFYSVDLSAEVSLKMFDEIIAPLVNGGGELAYPSLRHGENQN